MPPHEEDRIALAETVFRALAIEDTLTTAQARSFVRCLQSSWQVPTISWGANESVRQLDDARRLIHAAGVFQEIEGGTSPRGIYCYRRAAELLEWLSRSGDPLSATAPVALLAAGAFQLGGLPAMARGLLDEVEVREDGSRLFAQFFQADFDGVLRLAGEFWQRYPDLTRRAAAEQLLAGEDDGKISWYIAVELVRSLGLIADSLRRGDDQRLDLALRKLSALESVGARTFSDYPSLLVSLLHSAAKGFREASIYKPLLRLADTSPGHRTRLEAIARGQFSRGRGILWPSQRRGLERLLGDSSFALCTPTGSGKTLVANIALVKELLLRETERPAPLALYLVPSRALAGEVEAKLTSELGSDLIITGLYGGSDWGVTDYWLTAERPTVLIATVEKADALVRFLGPLLIARLRLLIVDEAHQVVPENNDAAVRAFADHSSRSLRLEGLVSRLIARAPTVVRIALTAVAQGASKHVASWIEGNTQAEAVGTRYRSTRQIIGKFEVAPGAPGVILLDLMNGRPLYVRGRDEPVYLRLQIPPMPQLPAAMRNSVNRFNELNVLWHALHLAREDRRILISVAQTPERTMGWFSDVLALPTWKDAIHFALPEDIDDVRRFQEARDTCVDYCGLDSYEVALLDCGIATSHGQMPQRLRRLMTELIDRRICSITVATATLTEGVNLPFDLIFLTALKRSTFDPDTQQQVVSPLGTSEFNNLAGRAGRPGATKGIEGITLVSLPLKPSSTARATIPIQRRQIAALHADYDALWEQLVREQRADSTVQSPLALLLRIIAQRAGESFDVEGEDFLTWLERVTPAEISEHAGTGATSPRANLADSIDELDAVLLSAIEELNDVENHALRGAEAEAFLTDLWRRTFSSVAAAQEDLLARAFVRRGRGVVDHVYPDAAERKRLYQYGFSPHVGRRFERVAPTIRGIMAAATGYGTQPSARRLEVFHALGAVISGDRGFGFRARRTATDQQLLESWVDVLSWWMDGESNRRPEPSSLRSWQRFVTDNLEFRLGTAIGAVVAQAWASGAVSGQSVPTLSTWRETTGLPWFAFWARELLRWGTLDPFVAFVLAQSLAGTRPQAGELRRDFDSWVNQRDIASTPDNVGSLNFVAVSL